MIGFIYSVRILHRKIWHYAKPFQLLVTLEKESSPSDKPYLSFAIKKLSTEVIVCSWDLSIEAKLGFISLVDNNYTGM